MGFDVYWREEDIQEASRIYNERVGGRLEDVLEEKNRQLQWFSEMPEVSRRFHNVFGLGSLVIAEARFSVESRDFRALCVVVKSERAIVYLDIVDKGGSNQERKLSQIRKRSSEIDQAIRQKLDRLSS